MEYCLDCVIKHLGDAKINQEEALMGYPEHALNVIGSLSQASIECYGASPELANEIRQHRLLIMKDIGYLPPYYELYNKVKRLIEEKGCGNCKEAQNAFKEKVKIAKSLQ